MTPRPAGRTLRAPGCELGTCPQCGAPATVVPLGDPADRHDHVRVWCAGAHWFLLPRDLLGRLQAPPSTD